MSSGHDPEPRSGPNCTTSRCRCRSFSVSKKSPVVCDSGPRQSPQFQAQHLQGGVRLHTWTSQVKLIYLAGRDQRFIRMSLENFDKVLPSTWKYMKVLWSLNCFFYTVESTPEIWLFCTKAWKEGRKPLRCTNSLKFADDSSDLRLCTLARRLCTLFSPSQQTLSSRAFLAEKRWPKYVAKWWRNFPKKIPAWLPHAPPWNHQLKEYWTFCLQTSGFKRFQFSGIFQVFSGHLHRESPDAWLHSLAEGSR